MITSTAEFVNEWNRNLLHTVNLERTKRELELSEKRLQQLAAELGECVVEVDGAAVVISGEPGEYRIVQYPLFRS